MSTKYKLKIDQNPQFQTVGSLTNRTWDPENVPIVSGRGATEDQLQVVDGKIEEVRRIIPDCSDDPFSHLQTKVRLMEEAFADCSDDPFVHLRGRVDNIQNAFEDCSDDPWVAVKGRLTELETRQNNCCNIPQDEFIALARAKINEIIAALQTCCDNVTPVVPIP